MYLNKLRDDLRRSTSRNQPLTRAAEQRLLAAARKGDDRAVREIVLEISGPAYRFGRTFCRHQDDAEDVMQDVLATVVRRLGEFRGDSSLSSWAYVVARNACARMRRKKKGEPAVLESLDAGGADHDVFHLADRGADPSGAAEAVEIREALRRSLADLPKPQREAVLLRDVEGLSAARAARLMKISVRALKSRLHRGRAGLRAALGPWLEKDRDRPKTDCPDIPGAASRFLEGELDRNACAGFEAHVARCPKCRRSCRSFQKMMKLCRAFGSAAPVPGADLKRTAAEALQRSAS